MAHPRVEEDEEPALTEELRAVMRPRTGRLLLVWVLILAVLALGALVASRTALSGLWHQVPAG
jgi:hypothetical protein